MSDQEVAQIVGLYENYLNSSPDSIYNNPFWNQHEKQLYRDFDFSRTSLFNGISSEQLFSIYQPFVLSVEPIGKKYQIRVLYSNSANDEPYVASKVWCIHKLSAVKEKGTWLLENLLAEETLNWKKQKIGMIEYLFPDNYSFDIKKAKRANGFCKKIIRRFNPKYRSGFQFYITDNIDDMGRLENFDFDFSGITTGKAREGMILSAKGDEYCPHEFVHKLLPKNKNRGHVIEEGLATFLGTKENVEKYKATIKKLADDFENLETYTLENILNNDVEWNGYQVAYPAGAIVCEIIGERKGDAGIIKLIKGSSINYNEIVSLVSEILNIDEGAFGKIWDEKISDYR